MEGISCIEELLYERHFLLYLEKHVINYSLIKVCRACMAAAYLTLMYSSYLSVPVGSFQIKRI